MSIDDIFLRVQAASLDHPISAAELLVRHLDQVKTEEQARRAARLATHVIGQRAGRWAEAMRATRWLRRHFPIESVLRSAAVAAWLAGEVSEATTNELLAAAADPHEPLASLLRTRVQIAEALAASERHAEAIELFAAIERTAEAASGPSAAWRALAIGANNLATQLLEVPLRDARLDDAMARLATASRTYWSKSGTWLNLERAEYLIALVANAQGRPDDALAATDRGLALLDEHGPEDVDRAFLLLARASACRTLGDEMGSAEALNAADVLAFAFESDDLKEWFEEERRRAVG